MASPYVERVINHLWQPAEGQSPPQVYALLDAARSDVIYPKIEGAGIESACLHRGDLAHELAWVAPYLVELQREDPFTKWLLGNGWGKSWGIFLESPATLSVLKRHFQTFLMVYDEEGKPLYFRYYDPRVLRVFLPICDKDQLLTMFGPVICYYVEGEGEDSMTRYSLLNTKLIQDVIQLAEPTVK